MFRKIFVLPAVLSLACVLMVADSAQAQRRGGGNRGGGNRGGGWGGSWGGVGVYIGPSTPYRNYNNNPYRSNYYNNYPYRSNYYSPWYDTRPSYYYTPTPSYYYTPVPAVEYVEPAPVNTANIRVIVPDSQARVWFDDQLTSQLGTDRIFQTPALTATGTYRIRASWMQGDSEMTQERSVTVSPGQTVLVDFTQR